MNDSFLIDTVRSAAPLVFSITNYVTVNDCANVILAAGASPVMSDDPREAADLAKIANCVVLNPGTPSESSVKAMLLAGKAANEAGIPVLLDPVGAGASPLRAEINRDLLKRIHFTAIRGNASEISFLAGRTFQGRGVDAGLENTGAEQAVRLLAEKTGAVVCASGPVDLISDGTRFLKVFNGHPLMPRITGSGCMSSALCGAFLGAVKNSPFDAVASAVISMGICGEIAAEHAGQGGTGTFRNLLIDAVSLLTVFLFKEYAHYEEI